MRTRITILLGKKRIKKQNRVTILQSDGTMSYTTMIQAWGGWVGEGEGGRGGEGWGLN